MYKFQSLIIQYTYSYIAIKFGTEVIKLVNVY